jgi:membrane protein YqaA with SNARE-associated domain
MLPTLALGIVSIGGPIIVAVVATLGLTAGAMCGAVLGLLKDQGVSRRKPNRKTVSTRQRGVSRRYTMGRPVLLAVKVSPSEPMVAEARRLVCKYHASSIDLA